MCREYIFLFYVSKNSNVIKIHSIFTLLAANNIYFLYDGNYRLGKQCTLNISDSKCRGLSNVTLITHHKLMNNELIRLRYIHSNCWYIICLYNIYTSA